MFKNKLYTILKNIIVQEKDIEKELENILLDKIYPVGSIYISVDSTSPSSLFGGTWEQIKDTFLLSAGDIYSAGTIGGEATHVLTKDEMPAHTHATWYYSTSGNKSWGFNYTSNNTAGESNESPSSSGVMESGGGNAHNNMPPYLAVYIWKRVQ